MNIKKILIPILTLSISTILITLFFEFSLRIAYPYFSNYNTEMWRYSKELKVPEPNPNLPFVHRKNIIENLYGVEFIIDENGFRIGEYKEEKIETRKILFLGDSFTVGWGVSFDSTISNLVEGFFERNANVQSINMGCGNYNTIMEVELFEQKGISLKPEIAILSFYINDLEDTPRILSNFEYYFMTNFYMYGFLFDKYIKLKSKYDSDFINNYYQNQYSKSDKVTKNADAISRLAQLCKVNNVKLLIVNIPDLRDLSDYKYNFVSKYIKGIADELNIAFLDLFHSVKDEDSKKLWVSYEDPHSNGFANNIFATAIYNKLNILGWLK